MRRDTQATWPARYADSHLKETGMRRRSPAYTSTRLAEGSVIGAILISER